jgi:hypothetical protein
MRDNGLNEMYHKIRQARNAQFSAALSLLRKKAATDPEVAEALRLLRPWVPGQGQDDETTNRHE